ncbi:MAG: hypothetical protein OXI66_05095 [Boseongicola sp.]|nr:hypothetical protein [Boseongicola sp.]MDE0345145.1 hypothetical protein [Boseongicola sp.]
MPKSPDPLAEQGTGHWSRDATEIVNDCSRQLGPGEAPTDVIERSFPLIAEHRRHREGDVPMMSRAREVAKHRLDQNDTDRVRVHERHYRKIRCLLMLGGNRLKILALTNGVKTGSPQFSPCRTTWIERPARTTSWALAKP